MSAPSKLSWVNCCKKQLRDFTKNVIRTYLIKDQGQLFLQRISYSQIELMSLAQESRTEGWTDALGWTWSKRITTKF